MNSNLAQAISSINAGDADYQTQIEQLTSQIAALQGITIFDGQELTPWSVDVTTANTAGNTAVADYAQSVPTDHAAFLKLIPGGKAFADAYFFKDRRLTLPNIKNYKYEGRLMLPTATDSNAPQALELDVEQRLSQVCRNHGFQWDFAEKVLRVWNRSPENHGWVSTGLSIARWTPMAWHAFELHAHVDANNVYYDGIVLDGSEIDLTKYSFPLIELNEADCMNNAIQLDSNEAGATYQVYIDAVKLTVS